MSTPDLETDPRLHDTWLTQLSQKEQDELRHRWNQRAEQEARRSRRECHRALVDHAATIVAFGVGDLLRGWDLGLGFFSALGLGAFVGGLIVVLDAPRSFALVMGASSLFLHQWMVRGGLTPGGAALLLPLCAVFWMVGRRREGAR